VQTNSLVNLVISTSVARLRGYLAPSAVALANVTTEPRARVCGRPAATLEIKNIFAAPGERMKLRKSTADVYRNGIYLTHGAINVAPAVPEPSTWAC